MGIINSHSVLMFKNNLIYILMNGMHAEVKSIGRLERSLSCLIIQ